MIFEDDLKNEISRISKVLGTRLNFDKRWDKILLDYLTVRQKIIEVKPRKTLINPEFKKELPNHPKSKEIRTIINYAKEGINLNYFQSKKLTQSNFHDHLQTEWNIYHLHLSLKRKGPRTFVQQGDNLLFVYVDDKHFVVLGSSKHTEGIFADTKWIEILHDHFPSLIEKYKDSSMENISPKVTATERQSLWNKGYTLGMTQVGNTVYTNPGIGRTTSGHGTSVVMACNNYQRWLFTVSEQVSKYKNEISEFLKIDPTNAKFKIRISKTFELIEANSDQLILTYPTLFEIEERP